LSKVLPEDLTPASLFAFLVSVKLYEMLLCRYQLTPAVTESPNGMTLTTAKTWPKKRTKESSQASDFAIAYRSAKDVVSEPKELYQCYLLAFIQTLHKPVWVSRVACSSAEI
jgi:hypothetical protein